MRLLLRFAREYLANYPPPTVDVAIPVAVRPLASPSYRRYPAFMVSPA
jgi:hypothetical protein